MQQTPGQLWVVATPIGNLQDLSPRAAETLRLADTILAEDTRVSRRLLDHYGIATAMESLHDHNERRVSEVLVERMVAGARMALISDAGTPLLSDPGYALVRLAQDRGVAVNVVPGPSAITAALSVAGMAARPFWFEGFLPPRTQARCQRIEALSTLSATLVFYEAPHRVAECLDDMARILGGEREAAYARELTKRFEEVRRDTLASLAARFVEQAPRGEFVIMVAGAPAAVGTDAETVRVLECLLDVLPTREAAAAAARITGVRKNEAYALALQLRETASDDED